MNNYFVLCKARTWALYTLNSRNVKVYLDISDVQDPVWEWFLHEIPQYSGTTKLNNWKAKKECQYLVYNKENDNAIAEDVYIKIFESTDKKKTKYVGLYDKDEKILCCLCLIIYDTERPHVTNQGYAPGRCPDVLYKY